MSWPGIAVFAICYVLIAMRRLSWLPLDRPAVVLVAASVSVGAGLITPDEALDAVDGETLLLLFGVMGMGAFLAVDGFFEAAEGFILRRARTPGALLGWVIWPTGLLSALITNDAVAVLAAPVVIALATRQNLPLTPYLLALATAVNTGSVATLVGNPQNMLCATLGHLEYREHLWLVGPIALVGLALNHAWIAWLYRRELAAVSLREASDRSAPIERKSLWTLAAICAVGIACIFGANLPFSAVSGFAFLLVFHRRDSRRLWQYIDWPLLVFFSGLFVVVETFVQSGAPARLFGMFPLAPLVEWASLPLAGVFLVGSNAVSNVPFILVVEPAMGALPDARLAWELLAVASTFAGNLTLLGSVANVIVAEAARSRGGIGFWEHLRVGGPLAVATTIMGTLWLVAV